MPALSQRPEQKRWWRNLRGGAPVVVHLQGRPVTARAEVIDDPAAVVDTVERLMIQLGAREASAQLYLRLDTSPPPGHELLAQALAGTVFIRITPTA